MVSVFVSHSKHDIELRKFFAEIFSGIGLRAHFMEFAELGGKYAGNEISWMIRAGFFSGHDTTAVFVLLGKSLANPPTNTPEFTHNWISFEVGAAAGCRKPVWVFEEFDKNIQFPIPFVTDYVKYDLDNVDHLKILRQIFKEKIQYPSGQQTIKPKQNVKCPWENCNAEYRFWSDADAINCPVCRRGITFNKTQ
ncbi:hypothetical protein [Candidatus Nitrosotenuis aquarius]|uniref:hypothetical protein n=1 Tax=Candidatus Nitrosotenuis aquarius TaxID=1846278 RepID=UPI0013C2CC9A|nr:hypothetical protein [Candidatus Nitrosotenuis aquarius]